MEREAVLRQKLELLKRARAAISLPKLSPGTEAETRLRTGLQARAKMADAKKEKASLFYELISVRVGAPAFTANAHEAWRHLKSTIIPC